MNEECKQLLQDNCVSDHMIELLEVFDYIRVKDIAEIDQDILKEIEENVRQKEFSGRFDPDSKDARKKFFGCEDIDLNRYTIPIRARRKLLAAASASTKLLSSRAEAEFINENRPIPTNTMYSTDCKAEFEADNSDSSEPFIKKAKISSRQLELKLQKEETFTVYCLKVMNDILAKANFMERANFRNVKVSFDVDTKTIKAKCQCVMPKCSAWFSCNMKGKTTSASSFKRHLINLHLNDTKQYRNEDPMKCEMPIENSERFNVRKAEDESDESDDNSLNVKLPSLVQSKMKKQKEKAFKFHCVKVMNDILDRAYRTERANDQHVKVWFDVDTQKYHAKCQCVLSNCSSWLSCNIKGASTSASGFTRHLKLKHFIDVERKRSAVSKAKDEEDEEEIEPAMSASRLAALKVEKEEEFKIHCVKVMNDILKEANCTERANDQHVIVNFDVERRKIKAQCLCVMSECSSLLTCNMNGTSTSASYFKRHLRTVHLIKGLESIKKPKGRMTVKDTSSDESLFGECSNYIPLQRRTSIEKIMIKSEIKEETLELEMFNDQTEQEKSASFEQVLQNSSSKRKEISKSKPRNPKKNSIQASSDLAGLEITLINQIKYFICEICGKRRQLKSFRDHHATHLPQRNFKCNICGAAFKTKTCVLGHKIVHKKKTFHCDLCPKAFKLKQLIREHIDCDHLNCKDYICSICGRDFGSNRLLSTHIYYHNKEKDFACNFCDFRAINKQKMERHMKSHTGERNFACEICGKRFLYKYNVTAHIKYVHNRGKRPLIAESKLICGVCGLKFQRICKTKQHMADIHGIFDETDN